MCHLQRHRNLLFIVCPLSGDFKAAIQEYKIQLGLLEESNDKINIAKCIGNMAAVQIEICEFDEAISSLTKSLESAEEFADVFGQAHAMKHLYLAFLAKNDNEQAHKWLKAYQLHVIKWQDGKEQEWVSSQIAKLDPV